MAEPTRDAADEKRLADTLPSYSANVGNIVEVAIAADDRLANDHGKLVQDDH
jgi:hypothetical protein